MYTAMPMARLYHFDDWFNCSPTASRPTAAEGTRKKRKVAHAEIITSSPYKQHLVETQHRSACASKPKTKNKQLSKTKRVSRKKAALGLATPCHKCGVDFGDMADLKRNDDWFQCEPCSAWFHESCGEEVGILDDDSFTCQKCF